MINVEMTEKELIYTLLALDAYSGLLMEDEEDPGPRKDDANFVSYVLKKLREKYLDADGRVKVEFLKGG